MESKIQGDYGRKWNGLKQEHENTVQAVKTITVNLSIMYNAYFEFGTILTIFIGTWYTGLNNKVKI